MKKSITYCCVLIMVSGICINRANSQIIEKIDSLEQALSHVDDTTTKIDLLLKLSKAQMEISNEKAISSAQQAYDLAEASSNEKDILLALLVLADAHSKGGPSLVKAVELAIRANVIAENLDMLTEFAKSLHILGSSYFQIDYLEESSEFHYEALSVYELLSDSVGICDVLTSIGGVHGLIGNREKALEFFSKSYNIALKLKYMEGISRNLANIGYYYQWINATEKSKEYLKEAININKRIGKRSWEATNYTYLAMVFMKQLIYDSTYFYADKAIKIFEDIGNYERVGELFGILSQSNLEFGNYEKAEQYALKAFELGKKYNFKRVKFYAVDNLHSIYTKLGDLEKAYKYQSLRYVLKDSIQSETSLAKISQLELLYDFEKKEQKDEALQQRKNFVIVIVILSLVVGLIAFLFTIFHYRVKARISSIEKNKMRDEIDYKNKELTTNVMSSMNNNEILSDISEKLLSIENQAVSGEVKNEIHKLSKEIYNTTDQGIWNEFEYRFNQVHLDFYDKLLQKFPELSPNERKLCAFLKLNMSSKDISTLTGQTINSINVARVRLRKKLGLSNSDVNTIAFLSNF